MNVKILLLLLCLTLTACSQKTTNVDKSKDYLDSYQFLFSLDIDLDHDGLSDKIAFYNNKNYESIVTYSIANTDGKIDLIGSISDAKIIDYNDDQQFDVAVELKLGGTVYSSEMMILEYDDGKVIAKKIDDFLKLPDNKYSIKESTFKISNDLGTEVYKIDDNFLSEVDKITTDKAYKLLRQSTVYYSYLDSEFGRVLVKSEKLSIKHQLLYLAEVKTYYSIDHENSSIIKVECLSDVLE